MSILIEYQEPLRLRLCRVMQNSRLSIREQEVVLALADQLSYPAIAVRLHISPFPNRYSAFPSEWQAPEMPLWERPSGRESRGLRDCTKTKSLISQVVGPVSTGLGGLKPALHSLSIS